MVSDGEDVTPEREEVNCSASTSQSDGGSPNKKRQHSDSIDKAAGNDAVPYKRFKIVKEEDEFMWSLPDDLCSYANDASEEFITEKQLKEQILLMLPRPSNLDPIKRLDEPLQNILKKEHPNQFELDKTYKKVQDKVGDVMGPLGKLWVMVEKVRTATEDVDPEDLPTTQQVAGVVEQTVTLVGQVVNLLTYERRKNVLTAVSGYSASQAAATLKEKASFLQLHDSELFGKKYREHILEMNKSMKQGTEMIAGRESATYPNKSSSSGSKFKNTGSQKPFLGGPSQNKRNSGGQYRSPTFNRKQKGMQRKSGSFLQQSSKHVQTDCKKLGEHRESSSCSSSNKRNIFRLCDPKSSTSRKDKVLSEGVGKTNKGQFHLRNSPRVQNTIFSGTGSNISSALNSFQQTRGKFSEHGSGRNVEKRSHTESVCLQGPLSEQSISCEEKGWGEQTCDKLKGIEQVYSVRTLQDGGFAFSEICVTRRGLDVKDRLERRLFRNSSGYNLKEICEVRMVRELVSVPLSVFWAGSRPTNFHKINESSHLSIASNNDKSCDIPRRYATLRSNSRGDSYGPGHSNFSSTKIGFYHKFEEINTGTNPKDRIFRDDCGLDQYVDFIICGQGSENKATVLGFERERQDNCIRPDTAHRNFVFDHPGSAPSTVRVSVPTTTATACTQTNKFLLCRSNTESKFKRGTFVVDKQFRVVQRSLSNSNPGTGCNSDRRITFRLGSSMSRSEDRGDLEFK